MYNSKKPYGDMEPSSHQSVRSSIGGENEKDVGNKLTDYKIICELGRGSYGIVNRVLSLVNNNEYVMKKINMKHVKQNHQQEALKEAQILKKLRHPNIIRYYTSFVENDYLYIIMEYAESGDLAALIKSHRDRREPFTEKQIWDFTWELCQAMDYLHNNKIIHRDIKTLNVFLSKDGHIKLGDLGVSKIVSSAAALQGTRVGTPLYLSPELVKQLPYDFKVDIWALGCVLYHLASLDPPFIGDNLITLGYNIVHKPPKALSTALSPKLTSLIMKFLDKDPASRPKISEIWDYFPSRYRNNTIKGIPSSVGHSDNDKNRVEYHNQSAAEILKIDDKDMKKENKTKVSPEKRSESTAIPVRPSTASQPRSKNSLLANEKGSGSKQGIGSNLSPVKINTLASPVKEREKGRDKSPVKQAQANNYVSEDGNGPSVAGNNSNSHIVRKEGGNSQAEGKYGAYKERKTIESEIAVEYKLKTVQTPPGHHIDSEIVLAKQARDYDLKKAQRRQDSGVLEENGGERRISDVARQTPIIGNGIRPTAPQLLMGGSQQGKDVKEMNQKRSVDNGIKIEHLLKNETKSDDPNKDIVKALISNSKDFYAQNQRPSTADARKILMNPLIKSTSPRIKINPKMNQMPSSLQANVSGSESMPSLFLKAGEGLRKAQQKEETTLEGKDTKREDDDISESFVELDDEGRKKSQWVNGGNGIRIRPVSAHLIKNMHNHLGQVAEGKGIKEVKSAETKKDIKVEANKVKVEENPYEIESHQNRAASVERPKSAVFAGRFAPKSAQLNKNSGDLNGNRSGLGAPYYMEGRAHGGWMTSERDKERILRGIIGDKGVSKQEDVLKEEGEDSGSGDEEDRRSPYRDMLKRNASSIIRYETVGKSMSKNVIDMSGKKIETNGDWSDEIKGIRGPIRPTTAMSVKKKLTIHDLM